MKQSYDKSIALKCITCGSDCSFETDETTGVVTCKKCNRIYYGGRDELIELNQEMINLELEETKEEITKDLMTDLKGIFKKHGFKLK